MPSVGWDLCCFGFSMKGLRLRSLQGAGLKGFTGFGAIVNSPPVDPCRASLYACLLTRPDT